MLDSPESLEYVSTIALYSAMIVYAIAFVFYAVDLANRSGDQIAESKGRTRFVRIAFSLTVLAWLLHLGATVLRGIGAERVPWANMYEFALTATLAAVFIFLLVQFFVDIRFLGTLVTGVAILFLGVTKINYYVPIVPLPPALEAARALAIGGIALRRLQAEPARAAFARASEAAGRARIPALAAEVEAAARVLEAPAARLDGEAAGFPLA